MNRPWISAGGPRPDGFAAGSALRVPAFRRYFMGSLFSVPGPWMQMTAQFWLVLDLTHSPLALSLLTALQFLPIMLLSLIGGAIADRMPRRRLLMATQGVAALQALAMGVLLVSGHLELWHIYALAMLLGVVGAMEQPLRQAFISELVDAERIPNAVAIASSVQNLGRIVGPALAGVIIATLGVGASFLVNAATFAGILVALLSIRPAMLVAVHSAPRRGVLREVRSGLGYALQTPSILFVLIATAFVGLFGQNFSTMVPLVATYLVHASTGEFGLLNSCLGVGSLLAALGLTLRGAPSGRRILLAGAGFGAILVAIGCSSSFLVSGALFLAVGFAAVTFSTSVSTSLLLQAPADMRGRMASMVSLLIAGTSPIGALLTGFVASSFGVGVAVVVNGVMCLVGIALAVAYQRRVQRISGPIDLKRAAVPLN